MSELRRGVPRPRPRRASTLAPLPHPAEHARALVAKLRESTYALPDWALFDQVRSRTGPAGGDEVLRVADAIAVRVKRPADRWTLHGFEVKLTQKDFHRELEQPEKCGPFKLYCAAWWLVVPCPWKRIVGTLSDLPDGWGLYEVGTGEPFPVVPAREREAEDPSPGFLRALLRGAATAELRAVEALAELGLGDVGQLDADGSSLTRVPRWPIARKLTRGRVALACRHVLERPPLAKGKAAPPIPCMACLADLPPDREALVAAIEDATDEDLAAYRDALDRRRRSA